MTSNGTALITGASAGIGAAYDPVAQMGVIGKNYCYQTGVNATLFFEGKYFNPFMNAGGYNATIDDFNTNWNFDRAPHNFVGGYNVSGGFNTALPIGYRPVPSGTPQWGSDWKRATAKWYQTAMVISASGSVMANRYNCFDLDPTYRNAFGQPLMRMTFDYKDNEHKMGTHAAQVVNDLLVGFKYHADVIAQLEATGQYGDVRGTTADFVIAT